MIKYDKEKLSPVGIYFITELNEILKDKNKEEQIDILKYGLNLLRGAE